MHLAGVRFLSGLLRLRNRLAGAQTKEPCRSWDIGLEEPAVDFCDPKLVRGTANRTPKHESIRTSEACRLAAPREEYR